MARYRRPADFEALYREYADVAYRFCCRLCRHTADAEDLAQEVLMLAGESLDQFEGRSPVQTWLYRIAVRRWERLAARRQPSTVPLAEAPEETATTDPESEAIERLRLERALELLPDSLREALILVKAEGYGYRGAAEALGVPQSTIQARVREAARRLRDSLDEDDAAGGPGARPRQEGAEVP